MKEKRSLNILVTGGAGFIGSALVDLLIARGHRVWVVDNLSTGKRSHVHPEAVFHELDIRDTPGLEKVFSSASFDLVSHHAAQVSVRRSVADPRYDASVNVAGFLNVMECCVRSGVRAVHLASSGGTVYGEQRSYPASEDHPLHPLSPYGISKLCSEQYLSYYYEVHRINAVVFRYANVYGPRQNCDGEAGVVAIFASKMLEGDQPVINGDGKQTRDYVFVGDVVGANLLSIESTGFHIFNVGTGKETDVNQIFHLLKKQTGSPILPEYGPPMSGEQRRSVIDARRITEELGWNPAVSLEEGLAITVASLRTP